MALMSEDKRVFFSGSAIFVNDETAVRAETAAGEAEDSAEIASLEADRAELAAADIIAGPVVWPDGVRRTLAERARDTYVILDAPGGADPTGQNDSTAALKAMMAECNTSGVKAELTKGDFVTTEVLSITKTGLILQGQGMGYGYGSAAYALADFSPQSRIIASGAFARRILTRRLARSSATDPQDDPMSAVVEVNADNVNLRDFAVWLDCDYSDMSPTNFGSDVDIGIFAGCRVGVQMMNVAVMGYFRKAGIYVDVTRDPLQLPELIGPDGQPLPKGASGASFRGADGTQVYNPYVRGARVALAVLGSKRGGANYYDQGLGAAVTDMRGASGCSDFNVYGGRLYAGGHHSGRRLANPIGYGSPLTRANMQAEGDFAPASLYVDGWSANGGTTTHGQGAIRGFNFFATRFASPEIFRVRLGRSDEVAFTGRAWIEAGNNSIPVQDVAGATIEVNNYTLNTYGHLATTETLTGSVRADAIVGGVFPPWLAPTTVFSGSESSGRERDYSVDSGQIDLADDTVISIVPPVLGGWMRIARSPNNAPIPNQSAMLYFDAGATPAVQPSGFVGAQVTLATTDLTNGTADGVDGNLNISVMNGIIKIKNMTGGSALFRYRWL